MKYEAEFTYQNNRFQVQQRKRLNLAWEMQSIKGLERFAHISFPFMLPIEQHSSE